jgi:hypothetical protein
MAQIKPVPEGPGSLLLFVEITTEALPLDSRAASSSRQYSFIFLYFEKDWLPELNLSYSIVSIKSIVVE